MVLIVIAGILPVSNREESWLTDDGNSLRQQLSPAQWWTLAVSCLSLALIVAAMAALYSVLPHIAADTGATQRQLTWIVDA